jgi:hypothetical protein
MMGTGDKLLILAVVVLIFVLVGIFGFLVADLLSDVGDAVGS